MSLENLKMPAHKMHHDNMKQHEVNGHKHHMADFMKHAAGHKFEQDKAQAMCGGGMAKMKK
jgi:hypothetical protein